MTPLREALLVAGAQGHSAPPGGPSPIDYALVTVAGLVVLYAGYKAVRHTFRPGEQSRDHIKWRVLDEGEWS